MSISKGAPPKMRNVTPSTSMGPSSPSYSGTNSGIRPTSKKVVAKDAKLLKTMKV